MTVERQGVSQIGRGRVKAEIDRARGADLQRRASVLVSGSLYLVGEARSLLLSGRLEDE